MKRFLKTKWFAILVTGFLVLNLITACSPVKTTSEVYGLTAYVVGFDYDTDEVLARDFNGNLWAFEGIEDWMIGDIATFVMDTKGSEIITDDEIVSVRYSGYLD